MANEDNIAAENEPMLGRARTPEKVLTAKAHSVGGSARNATDTPEERFAVLQDMTCGYLTDDEEAKIACAFEFAAKVHAGQCRKSGEPFVAHPVEVAIILADLHMDADTLCAALLHDTVEDTDATSEQLAEMFGQDVAELVEGVTKITRIDVGSLSDEQAATIRKMFVAMNKDIRVVVIKLADRLHNMRTLGSLREDRRIYKSRETLEIYAPIAHRLGINSIKWELEDLAFFYLEPSKYKQVSRMVTVSRAEREAYLENVLDILTEEMDKIGIEATVVGRPKHLYSIYLKMKKKDKDFSEIYDLIAVRLIVKSIKDCYSALGAVHSLWHPMPGRFKDYIAMPKYNMYQSLHTTVIGPAGHPLEVQIRTEEMHQNSEFGVAAHWLYKEGGNKAARDAEFQKQLAWLRQMVDWQDETSDSREFLKDLKIDLDASEVFVFTPKGEAKSLRAGSTPVDFAYAIHTEVGNHCVGAKVNGSIVPLSYKLQTGDRVEILTQKSATPSRGWLSIVKTPSARSKIRNYFSKVSRSDDLIEGRDKLMTEVRKRNLGISTAQASRVLKDVADNLGYKDVDDLYVSLGVGRESVQHVANRLLKQLVDRGNREAEQPEIGFSPMATGKMPPMLTSVKRPKRHETHSSNGVVVRGLNDVLVRLSKCCNPVPGDEIIGFVTRGRGVSVHRADCPNAADLMTEPERIIEVQWDADRDIDSSYQIDLYIEAMDRLHLFSDVANVFSEAEVNVISVNTNTQRDGVAQMRFVFQVSDHAQIREVIERLYQVDGVFEARRMFPGEAVGKRPGKKD